MMIVYIILIAWVIGFLITKKFNPINWFSDTTECPENRLCGPITDVSTGSIEYDARKTTSKYNLELNSDIYFTMSYKTPVTLGTIENILNSWKIIFYDNSVTDNTSESRIIAEEVYERTSNSDMFIGETNISRNVYIKSDVNILDVANRRQIVAVVLYETTLVPGEYNNAVNVSSSEPWNENDRFTAEQVVSVTEIDTEDLEKKLKLVDSGEIDNFKINFRFTMLSELQQFSSELQYREDEEKLKYFICKFGLISHTKFRVVSLEDGTLFFIDPVTNENLFTRLFWGFLPIQATNIGFKWSLHPSDKTRALFKVNTSAITTWTIPSRSIQYEDRIKTENYFIMYNSVDDRLDCINILNDTDRDTVNLSIVNNDTYKSGFIPEPEGTLILSRVGTSSISNKLKLDFFDGADKPKLTWFHTDIEKIKEAANPPHAFRIGNSKLSGTFVGGLGYEDALYATYIQMYYNIRSNIFSKNFVVSLATESDGRASYTFSLAVYHNSSILYNESKPS